MRSFETVTSSDPVEGIERGPAIVGSRVELQLLTTLRCNLRCSYCSLGVGEVLGSRRKVSYSLEALDAFIRKHLAGYEIYVTFYGGEPTLNLGFITAVMERYPGFRFQLQTNGTLLAKLSNILVSIDGGERVTDGHRGCGIYRRVLKNIGAVRDRIGGTLTARVTWNDEDTTF